MKELIEKINALQEENSKQNEKINALQAENDKLNERLNNCAKQFKKMIQRIGELEAKQNNTSTEKQEKSDSKPSNPSSGTTTHQEEEKPLESTETASNQIVEEDATPKKEEKALEKKHMYFKEVTTLTDDILDELKKNYSTSEILKLFKIDLVNHTIVSKTSRDIFGYGEESKELRDMIAMDSKEGKRLMKMVAIGV